MPEVLLVSRAPGQHRAILSHTHLGGRAAAQHGTELELGWRAPSTPYPTSPPPHPTHRQGLNPTADPFLPNVFSCVGKSLISFSPADVRVLPGSSMSLLSLSSPGSTHLPC